MIILAVLAVVTAAVVVVVRVLVNPAGGPKPAVPPVDTSGPVPVTSTSVPTAPLAAPPPGFPDLDGFTDVSHDHDVSQHYALATFTSPTGLQCAMWSSRGDTAAFCFGEIPGLDHPANQVYVGDYKAYFDQNTPPDTDKLNGKPLASGQKVILGAGGNPDGRRPDHLRCARCSGRVASSSCWPGVVLPGLVVVAIAARYKGYRYPIEIIGHAVWLYHRFALSLRDVEELMLARGVAVTYETIRSWCARFGPDYANQLRRRRPGPGDKWHLDEVFVKINGTTHYLWRAVDQHGNVLDILVQSRRNAVAAKRFFRKLLKGLRYVPRVIVTDKLASYQVAHRKLLPSVTHRRSKYLNNRAENSHQPTRIRERVMKRFASPGQAQRFLFAFSHIRQHFRPRRHLMSAPQWRTEMTNRLAVWDEITAAAAA